MVEPVYTVQQAYGKPFAELTPPEGWEFTGEFRSPLENDVSLALGVPVVAMSGAPPCAASPRLILRRVKRKRIVFEEIARRQEASDGEWVTRVDGPEAPWKVAGNYKAIAPMVIYSRREEEF